MVNICMSEPLDIEQKTRLTWSQHVAFKATCSELGFKPADIQRALILQFIREHHAGKALHALGIANRTAEGTE